MATTSEVKAGLDAISAIIAGSNQKLNQAKAALLAARNQLAAIPTQYADVIETINGFTPSGAFEQLTQDEKAKLQVEFLALKSALEGHLDSLGVAYSNPGASSSSSS